MTANSSMPGWVAPLLRFAAIYNLTWGIFVVLMPSVPFGWWGLAPPNHPPFLQSLGMVIGVYGVGYWIAANDAATHWPIVLVGLLGKIFGPVGFVYSALSGELPWSMTPTFLANDVAWWIPFTAILVHAARIQELRRAAANGLTLENALRAAVLPDGKNLYELSHESPLLLVCVRHFGCTYCREMLFDLAAQHEKIDQAGLKKIVIHMGTVEQAGPFLTRYGLSETDQISDPDRHLYRALELPFGTLSQLTSVKTFWRAMVEGVVFRFGFGPFVGNGLQLPGAFIIKDGQVTRAIRHDSPADRTDFEGLVCSM